MPLLPSLRRTLHARSAESRATTVDTLGVLSPTEDAAEICAALDDPSPLVVMVAARALTRSEGGIHAEALMGHLHRFQEWRPSFLAAMLSAAGPGMAPALLGREKDPELRAAVLRLIARVGAADQLAVVRTELDAPEEAVRLAAVRARACRG